MKQYLEVKENAQAEMEHYQGKENEYNVELSKSNVEQVKKAKAERDRITRTLSNEETRLENSIRSYVDLFNKRPYAFFGMPAIKKSLDILEEIKQGYRKDIKKERKNVEKQKEKVRQIKKKAAKEAGITIKVRRKLKRMLK